MRNRGQLILGVIVVIIGTVLLLGNLFDVDLWTLCWPLALILLGLALLLRPQLIASDSSGQQRLIGDLRRTGVWTVSDEDFLIGIGDLTLDMSEAEIPVGETSIGVRCFVGAVRVYVPEDVGVALSCTALVVDARLDGRKRESVLAPVRIESDNYAAAERRIILATTSFVADVRVTRRANE